VTWLPIPPPPPTLPIPTTLHSYHFPPPPPAVPGSPPRLLLTVEPFVVFPPPHAVSPSTTHCAWAAHCTAWTLLACTFALLPHRHEHWVCTWDWTLDSSTTAQPVVTTLCTTFCHGGPCIPHPTHITHTTPHPRPHTPAPYLPPVPTPHSGPDGHVTGVDVACADAGRASFRRTRRDGHLGPVDLKPAVGMNDNNQDHARQEHRDTTRSAAPALTLALITSGEHARRQRAADGIRLHTSHAALHAAPR